MSGTDEYRNISEKETKKTISYCVADTVRNLQLSHVTSGKHVTSDEDDANKLCCALEATFMHGLKDKYLRSDAPSDKRVRRNNRTSGGLPEPVFWSLLKSITHRNVLAELNSLKFINTDIGRCRAWLRLALNDSLIECYFTSLLREKATLADAYHPSAFLMDPEETTIFLSYLQGTASLTFTLSYKSSVLNEWTTTPLALAGLLPHSVSSNLDSLDRRPSMSSVASSSSDGSSIASTTSDAVEVFRGVPKRSYSHSERLGMGPGQGRHGGITGNVGGNITAVATTPQENQQHPEQYSWQGGTQESLVMQGTLLAPANVTVDGMDRTQSTHNDTLKFSIDCEVKGVGSALSSATDANGFGPCSNLPKESASLGMRCGVAPSLSAKLSLLSSGLECKKSLPPDDMTGSSCSTPLTDGVNSHASPASSETPSDEVSPALEAMEDPFTLNVRLVTNANSTANMNAGPLNLHAMCPSDGVRGASASLNGALLRMPGIAAAPLGLSAVDDDEVTPETPSRVDDAINRRKSSGRDLFGSEEDIYTLSTGGREATSETGGSLHPVVGRQERAASSAYPNTEHASMSSSAPCSSLSNIVVVHKRKTGVYNPFQNILKMGNLEKRTGTILLWKEYHCVLAPMSLQLFNPGSEVHGKPKEVYMVAHCQGVIRGGSSNLFQVGGGNRCCLELTYSGTRIHLRAPSEEQADDWVERLQEAITAMQFLPADDNDTTIQGPQNHCTSGPPHPEPTVDESCLVQPLLHGVLKVQQIQQEETAGTAQAWKSFYFTLDKDTLCRYAMSDRNGAPVRTHGTRELRDVERKRGAPRRFSIVLGGDTLHLRAVSEMEARLWVHMLRRVQGQQTGSGEHGCKSPERAWGRNGEGEEEGATITSSFLNLLTELPAEKGLDAQNCKCAGCGREIGFCYGKAKVCSYSRRYYCVHCHADDLVLIPGRVLHNWDVSLQKVAKQAKEFLEYIAEEPLLDVSEVNPKLYKHVAELASLRTMRQQLKSLRAYLFTCRSIVADELRRRVLPREYLLAHMHLYSITDLQQVIDGRFAPFLAKTIKFASDHVYSCGLCSQKGFICEICNSSEIIYPFEVSSTIRCERCQAVFHKACKGSTVACPKCMRRELRTMQRYCRPEEHTGPSQAIPEFPYSSSP
ncbi:pleckstrin homology domain-containing family M member 1-like [Petromyzon marinus]|uniref:pleckstrin homology domain-containing family M member 1-like n=1 Tax=Petromyzon marinus TaxID=7757 RepID=UPI003F70088F